MFCKHKWELLSETTTESKLEHSMRVIHKQAKVTIPHQMSCAERKHIQVFTCQDCGKLKRFVEKI